MTLLQADQIQFFRNFHTWKHLEHYQYQSCDVFFKAHYSDGIHSVYVNDTPIDIFISIKKGAPLVIYMDGNCPRSSKRIPPFFSGFGVTPKDIDVSYISISDPSLALSDDLTLAWYAGSYQLPLQKILPDILNHLISWSQSKNVIFCGGSGGGFACLYYSSFFDCCTALVWNAQTDICEYNARHILKYCQDAFQKKYPIEKAQKYLNQNIEPNIFERYRKQKNNVIFMQSISDWHVEKHLLPFLRQTGYPEITTEYNGHLRNNFFLYLSNWGEGHIPPSKETLSYMLRKFLSKQSNDWYFDESFIKNTLENAFLLKAE